MFCNKLYVITIFYVFCRKERLFPHLRNLYFPWFVQHFSLLMSQWKFMYKARNQSLCMGRFVCISVKLNLSSDVIVWLSTFRGFMLTVVSSPNVKINEIRNELTNWEFSFNFCSLYFWNLQRLCSLHARKTQIECAC